MRQVPCRVPVLAIACAAIVGAAAIGGQQTAPQTPPQTPTPPPVFRAGVDLIQLDVTVVDADGHPVHGLTKDDFTLIDRGKTRAIATIAELAADHPPGSSLPANVPLDVANNQTAAADRLVVIILDDLHFRNRTEEAKALVHQVVEGIGAGATLCLVTTSRDLDVEPTEDRARLLIAIDGFLDRFDPGRGPGGAASLASVFGALGTYRLVGNVAKMIGAEDGRRKAFIWISAGVAGAPLAPDATKSPSGRADPCASSTAAAWDCEEIAGMLEKLHKSSVAVYTVNPGGPTDGGGGSLASIARMTGGFNVPAGNLDAGMSRLLTDLDNYYMLGFYPDLPIDKKYHQVEVRMNRPGLTVRSRNGYQPGGPPPPPKNNTALSMLIGPAMPNTGLPLQLSAVPFFTSKSSVQLVATLEIDLAAFPPATANGVVDDTFEFGLFAADLKKKKVTQTVARRVEVMWPNESGQPSGSPKFRVQIVLTLPPGPYQLRASALGTATKKSGSVYLLIDVPNESNQPLGLSGLALTSKLSAASEPRLIDEKPLVGLTLPFAPSLARVFAPDDELRVFFQVHREKATTPVDGTVAVVDAQGNEHLKMPWQLSDVRESSIDLRCPLAGIPPGAYHLVVTASDGKNRASRELGIGVQ
jgi:VWFA-related protein